MVVVSSRVTVSSVQCCVCDVSSGSAAARECGGRRRSGTRLVVDGRRVPPALRGCGGPGGHQQRGGGRQRLLRRGAGQPRQPPAEDSLARPLSRPRRLQHLRVQHCE